MAKAKFDIKTEATRPLYAGVGVTDLAVEAVRELRRRRAEALADVQKDVAEVVDLDSSPRRCASRPSPSSTPASTRSAKDAKARRAAIEARVAELQAEAKAYPAKVQTLVDDNVATANDTYADLVKRGETLVGRIRRQESTKATVTSAKTTVAKAKTTATQAKKAAEIDRQRRPRPPRSRRPSHEHRGQEEHRRRRRAAPRPPPPRPRRPRPTRSRPSPTPPRRSATEEKPTSS